ncbi:MAG: hypothetical protein ACO27L_04440 [Schleiferiaceae bacterium]
MQRAEDALVHSALGQQDVAPDVVSLAAAVQSTARLLVQLKAPWQAEPDKVATAVLEVEPVAG